jgi:hypothetical protein
MGVEQKSGGHGFGGTGAAACRDAARAGEQSCNEASGAAGGGGVGIGAGKTGGTLGLGILAAAGGITGHQEYWQIRHSSCSKLMLQIPAIGFLWYVNPCHNLQQAALRQAARLAPHSQGL